jgi:hypothetical protein
VNTFYRFTDIKINHDKYEILTNNIKYTNKTINLQVTADKTIMIKTASKQQGKWILGVYINAYNSTRLIINKMKQVVYKLSNMIRLKKIIYNHIIYLVIFISFFHFILY